MGPRDVRRGLLATALLASLALITGCAGGETRPPAPQQTARGRALPHAAGPSTLPAPHSMVFHGARDSRMVALTFDADMTPAMWRALDAGRITSSFDRRIVDTLDATGTPATIFATGMWVERYPTETKALAADPLIEFGDHSYRHSAFTAPCFGLPVLSPAQWAPDLRRAAASLDRQIPRRTPYFRFPGGCHDEAAVRAVLAAGLTPIQWDVISGDAFGHDPRAIAETVLREARGGSIVVMHLNGAPTAPETHAALPQIIRGLRAKGLRLVKVSDLLAAR